MLLRVARGCDAAAAAGASSLSLLASLLPLGFDLQALETVP